MEFIIINQSDGFKEQNRFAQLKYIMNKFALSELQIVG